MGSCGLEQREKNSLVQRASVLGALVRMRTHVVFFKKRVTLLIQDLEKSASDTSE